MNKECPNPYLAQEKKIRFVEGIVKEGVLDKILLSERDQNIGMIANVTETPYRRLGEIYPNPATGKPLTGTRIGQIVDMFLRKSWAHASTCLQAAYPREEILMKKLSLPEDGPGLRIKEAMERGISDPKQLRELVGSNADKLAHARGTLKKRGIEVPFIHEYAGFKEKAAAETDDKELQTMLDSHSDESLRGYLNYHRKDTDKVLLYLSSVAKSAGLHLRSNLLHLIEESIERNDKTLPRRTVKKKRSKGKWAGIYHIVYAKHQKRVIEIIKNDPNLQRFKENPVRLICGTFWGKIPTTTELTRLTRKVKKYTNIAPLIKEVAGQRLNKTKREEYLRGCPVPVFRLKDCHFYLKSQVGELETFLKSAINH